MECATLFKVLLPRRLGYFFTCPIVSDSFFIAFKIEAIGILQQYLNQILMPVKNPTSPNML